MGNPRVIGVGGLLTSGKDVFADALVERLGFVKMGMSDPLADALYALNPLIGEETYESIRWRELIDEVGYTRAKEVPEVRRLLQVMGTEVGRQMIDSEVWVNIARRNIENYLATGNSVVITGIRFANELEMAHRFIGSTSVWIERPGVGSTGEHASENSVGPDDFDRQIMNSDTIESLGDKAVEVARA